LKTGPAPRGLAEDVRRYGAWMRSRRPWRIGHLYPQIEVTPELIAACARPSCGNGIFDTENPANTGLAGLQVGHKLTVIAWLWARTVKSPNPAFSHVDVPLASTFILSSKAGKEAYVQPMVEGDSYRFEVRTGTPPESAKGGTTKLESGRVSVPVVGTPMDYKYIRAEGSAGRMGAKLMAVVAEGARGRVYLASDTLSKKRLPGRRNQHGSRKVTFAWRPLPGGTASTLWAEDVYGDLFTPRQLVALTTFSDLVQEAIAKRPRRCPGRRHARRWPGAGRRRHGATAYAEAVGVYLGLH
jgi:putative DNA methylase